MKKKHDLLVRYRAFRIWQQLGYFPWKKPSSKSRKSESGDFYKGAFDSIPFLNDDAKRTFTHLLFRPGYMIRDYIKGDHERYLAPLTALIIFYAFFALVSAVLQPVQQEPSNLIESAIQIEREEDTERGEQTENLLRRTAQLVQQGYNYLNLDRHPEMVDNRPKAALAALEGTLRSQGIPLFLGEFILLWLAMLSSLRRSKLKASAIAAASAYILCLFSFFMLFALLLTFGESSTVGGVLMLAVFMIVFHQWLGVSWPKSFKLSVKTGIMYLLYLGMVLMLVSMIVLIIAWIKGA